MSPPANEAVRQIGRGLLPFALLLQGLFSFGFGLFGVWTGFSQIGGPPSLVDWAWYQPLTVGVFLALGGAASLIACWTFAKDEPEPAARRLKSGSMWATIVFDVLLPLGLVLIWLAASPVFRTESLVAGWAFWELVFGLVALGVWSYAKRPPFGWIGGRSFSLIVAAAVLLIGVAALGARASADSFNSWVAQQQRHGPCAIHGGQCWASVDITSAREVATKLGHPVAWLPAGNGVKPVNLRTTSDSAYEYASIVGAHLDAFVISHPGRVFASLDSRGSPFSCFRSPFRRSSRGTRDKRGRASGCAEPRSWTQSAGIIVNAGIPPCSEPAGRNVSSRAQKDSMSGTSGAVISTSWSADPSHHSTSAQPPLNRTTRASALPRRIENPTESGSSTESLSASFRGQSPEPSRHVSGPTSNPAWLHSGRRRSTSSAARSKSRSVMGQSSRQPGGGASADR